MLPSSKRLTAHDVKDIMEKGRVAHSPLFLLRYIPNAGVQTKIVAIAPVKVVKTAAGRNELKRKTYEVVRKLYPRITPGFKIALLAKSPAITASVATIEADLKDLFVKAKLF
jgi:ribonuclease P protein component